MLAQLQLNSISTFVTHSNRSFMLSHKTQVEQKTQKHVLLYPRIQLFHKKQAISTNKSLRLYAIDEDTQLQDKVTGIVFPKVQQLWAGEKQRCLGTGAQFRKRFILFKQKNYAISLYVEADKAAKELAIRQRGGFFDDNNDEDYCIALVDGSFIKTLQIQFARSYSAEQYLQPLMDSMVPKLRLMGHMATFESVYNRLQSEEFQNGSTLRFLWHLNGTLDIQLQSQEEDALNQDKIVAKVPQQAFTRAFFEAYLGSDSILPQAKQAFAQGARQLLESDNEKRWFMRGGSG